MSRRDELTVSLVACKHEIEQLEITGEHNNRDIVTLVEKITRLVEEAVVSGRDSGHHNAKQKLHHVLRMELDNIRLRKNNMLLRTELRAQTKKAIHFR